ncbi:hypothetical protein HaLaN_23996, partial [Haematococcus lacustris]
MELFRTLLMQKVSFFEQRGEVAPVTPFPPLPYMAAACTQL